MSPNEGDASKIFTRKVLAKGRVTIPEVYRDIEGIEVGDKVTMMIMRVTKSPENLKKAEERKKKKGQVTKSITDQ